MPKGTRVEKVFQALKREGYPVDSAARISQAKTGLSLKTGKPPKMPAKPKQIETKRKKKQKDNPPPLPVISLAIIPGAPPSMKNKRLK